MRGRLPTTTPEQDTQVVAAYVAGDKLMAICIAFGITPNVLRRILADAGVARRPSGRPSLGRPSRPSPGGRRVTAPEQDAALVAAYLDGAPLAALSQRYHISINAVRDRIAEADIPRRPRGRPRRNA